MPYGGNDWLEITKEEIIEPGLPICDPHHHYWDLRVERTPYGRYLLHELLNDINDHNVTSTVFIEARAMYSADLEKNYRPVGEVEFVEGLSAASASGIYGKSRASASIIGHANLNLGNKVEPILESLLEASPRRFKGIRHIVAWDDDKKVDSIPVYNLEEQMSTKNFIDGAKVLSKMGLSFDSWMYFHQLPQLLNLAKEVPDLPIIVDHIGGILLIGEYANKKEEILKIWEKNISDLSECPNVEIKLGGLGMPITGHDWHLRNTPVGSEELANQMKYYLDYCIEKFGPQRGMFESNFPVDKVSFSYNVLYNAFKRYSKNYSKSERAAMFHDNAIRFYKVEEL
ncbi:MAG: amidohydrolase family protein [Dehalococcoidia bacterium]|jgi:predicted TIM-barrel fold metal-dependent hydrolase|nr:amidohydrolase family protein [Dehalococcoidia bacterium]